MNRRQFLKGMAAMGATILLPPFNKELFASPVGKKVLVLGIDGMDVRLTRQYIDMGFLPNVARLIRKGGISPMQTSIPPQSPVAWSNATVGGSPEVHGIYDFIHRKPETMAPYLSTSTVSPPKRMIHIGNYQIPLDQGETRLLRKGTAFWEPLGKRDIPTTIFKMPANFPCQSSSVKMVSGMGTPDLRGGYGNYSVFTTAPEHYGKDLTGGMVIPVNFRRGRFDARLPGPENSLKKGSPAADIPVTIWRDKKNPVVRIRLQANELLLKEGEWSDWQEIAFPVLGPLHKVSGICKLYIKQVHPEFSMYVSPVNIDPANPSLPVVSPERYGEKLVDNVGQFYTQGFPEDTKALSEGILTEDEYLELADQVFTERSDLLDYELSRFARLDTGMHFFYFSSLDQNTHMYWRMMDESNPLYTPELAEKYGQTILRYYIKVDQVVKKVLDTIDTDDPKTTFMIMSDHGFGAFNRQVNLNTWLYENGYLAMDCRPGRHGSRDGYFSGVNWPRTGAYNVGINCIYLNRQGREKDGIVTSGQVKGLLERLAKDLKAMKDPKTGEKAVYRVRIVSRQEHQRHPHAPDLIVGWNNGFRNSWKSILGGFEADVFRDNTDKWSGDHCIDPFFVPATLISNKAIKRPPSLSDIGPSILQAFGIQPPASMTGKPLFKI